MLQIKQLCKEYRTGDLVQKALDHVDLMADFTMEDYYHYVKEPFSTLA